ncbi:ABC transporter substrate-binding protein [Terrisporobacter glycolicus]|uniref:Oligopeptide-binding protein AppA n=1 Tax=Terrisporobacter glycolicus ATCC 14880 = DSM 1288 TaxID=1121315 RepID=A0ABZ2ERN2_9FIRM|nr:ABC transporter substrate-binding protein [Terrisporobacter glycolicus]
MKITSKLLALGLAGTMLLSVGCSSKGGSSEGSNITSMSIVAGGDAVNLNPLYANDRVSMTVMNSLFNPLYVVNEKGEKTFYLAESVNPSDDFLTYTVKLKPNLKWHDGEALTADDLIFTMDSILDEKQAAISRGKFVIEDKAVEVKKIDDTTVEFKLPGVSTSFESMLGDIRIIPKHIYKDEKDLAKSEKNSKPIGNGAYKFKEYKTGELITLERFDEYYGEKGNLETVTYRVIADSNSANMALQNGEVQAKYVQPDEVADVEGKGNVDIVAFDEGMVDNLVFMQDVNKTLKDAKVRQALSYAINKDEIITAAYKSEEYAEKAYSLFASSTMSYTNDVEKYEQDKEKSKKLLKEAGASDLKLKLAYSTHKSQQEKIALVIQSNLKEVGVEVELKPMEKSAFYGELWDGKNASFDLALNGYVMGSEPAEYASIFVSGGSDNIAGYSNKKIDKKFKEALKETDETKRSDLYKEIQKTLAEDAALYPICYSKSIVAVDKNYDVTEANLVPIFMFRDLNGIKVKN